MYDNLSPLAAHVAYMPKLVGCTSYIACARFTLVQDVTVQNDVRRHASVPRATSHVARRDVLGLAWQTYEDG